MRSVSAGSEEGFALLEAVLALAILSLVAVAVMAYIGADLRASARAREVLPGAALAEHRMAYLRVAPVTDLQHLPDSLESGRFEPPFEDYEWSAEVEPVRGEANLFEVEVVVHWGGGGSFPLRTRLYRPQPLIRAPVTAEEGR